MANLTHPNFIIGLLSAIFGACAIGFRANNMTDVSFILVYIAIGLLLVHWIWSIVDVGKTDTLEGSQKKFWLIVVIAIPLGGMFYYIMHSRKNTIVD